MQGILININNLDQEWGEWHNSAGWVNGTIPIIATPGNHEYQYPTNTKRIWTTKNDNHINVDVVNLENIFNGNKKTDYKR